MIKTVEEIKKQLEQDKEEVLRKKIKITEDRINSFLEALVSKSNITINDGDIEYNEAAAVITIDCDIPFVEEIMKQLKQDPNLMIKVGPKRYYITLKQ